MNTKQMTMTLVLAVMAAGIAHGGYPSIDDARELFSSENLNSTNQLYQSERFQRFMLGMQATPSPFDAAKMEAFLVSAMTSVVVFVSTNVVDDGVQPCMLEDRGYAFWLLSYLTFRHFPINAELCLALARYIGTLKTADFPTPLANRWGGPVQKVILTTNEMVIAAQRAKWKAAEAAYKAKRDHQTRIRRANVAVLQYRRNLLRICKLAVDGCRKTMPRDKYETFTNELVRISKATQKEASVYLGCGGAVIPSANSTPHSSTQKGLKDNKPKEDFEVDI